MGVSVRSSDSTAAAGGGGGGDRKEVTEPVPQPGAAPRATGHDFKTPARPTMSEMLKNIGSVKLRTIDAVR